MVRIYERSSWWRALAREAVLRTLAVLGLFSLVYWLWEALGKAPWEHPNALIEEPIVVWGGVALSVGLGLILPFKKLFEESSTLYRSRSKVDWGRERMYVRTEAITSFWLVVDAAIEVIWPDGDPIADALVKHPYPSGGSSSEALSKLASAIYSKHAQSGRVRRLWQTSLVRQRVTEHDFASFHTARIKLETYYSHCKAEWDVSSDFEAWARRSIMRPDAKHVKLLAYLKTALELAVHGTEYYASDTEWWQLGCLWERELKRSIPDTEGLHRLEAEREHPET